MTIGGPETGPGLPRPGHSLSLDTSDEQGHRVMEIDAASGADTRGINSDIESGCNKVKTGDQSHF